jgi:hypothetical protein
LACCNLIKLGKVTKTPFNNDYIKFDLVKFSSLKIIDYFCSDKHFKINQPSFRKIYAYREIKFSSNVCTLENSRAGLLSFVGAGIKTGLAVCVAELEHKN